MALHYLWVIFIIGGFGIGLYKFIFLGDTEIFSEMVNSTFSSAETGFQLSIGLTGALTLWLGLMKIGENGGMVTILSRVISPLFQKIFPELPKGHPAYGAIVMNVAANMLNLDNAATPLGLKAMKEMQNSNPSDDTASNSQIMFLVLNTSGLTLIPISIMVYRAELGAANPADVFIPILISTFASTMGGLLITSIIQKINLFNKVVMAYLGTMTLLIGAVIFFFVTMPKEQVETVSSLMSGIILMSLISSFVILAVRKKVNVFESFIDGAKDGFKVAITIIPYLIGMLVAIGIFRTSGALDFIVDLFRMFFGAIGVNSDFVDALPTAFMKPLSGSGARGMMVEAIQNPSLGGVDGFIGRLVSTIQGTTDTTFYVLAVYFGSVGIKKTRHALGAGLAADFIGICTAIVIAYVFFH